MVVALVGSLLWALNYPIQQAEWTCQTKPPIEQSTTVTVYKLVRCKPDNALGKFAKAAEATGLKLTDVLLATFTLGLVVVGALQVYWLQQTMKATALAAEAGDKSARAAIGIELPIIRAKPDKLHSLETRIDDNAIKVFYSVGGVTPVNLGNTKAFPVEVKSGIVYGKGLPSVYVVE